VLFDDTAAGDDAFAYNTGWFFNSYEAAGPTWRPLSGHHFFMRFFSDNITSVEAISLFQETQKYLQLHMFPIPYRINVIQ
jgi:hypothetical protein